MLPKSSGYLKEAEEIPALPNTIFSLEERRMEGNTDQVAHENFLFHRCEAVALVSVAWGGWEHHT